MAPIDINNQEISSITLNGNTDIDTVEVNGQEVFSASPTLSITNGLKAHYVFDSNNTEDLSVNNNDATLVNTSFNSNGGPNGNGAMVTNADVNSYIDTNFVAGDGDMTIFLSGRVRNPDGSNNQDLWQTESPEWQPGVWVETNTMRNHFGVNHPDGHFSDSSISIDGSTFFNFGGRSSNSRGADNILDGQVLSRFSTNNFFDRNSGNSTLKLGGVEYAQSGLDILEFVFFDRALSSSEISQITQEMR